MDLACLDGVVVPKDEARLPVTDEGLLRGDGVFEVMRLYDGRPYALDEHLARMGRSAQTLRLELDTAAVAADVEALLAAAQPGDALLRVLATRGGHRVALIEEMPALPGTLRLVCVTYAPTRILDGVKSLSYAANMLAQRIAREQGADDALFVTPHGRVLEAPTSSFFAVVDGVLTTPPLDDHVLDSITRRKVLEAVDVLEAPIARDDLARASGAFLASTLKEVAPVGRVDDLELDPADPVVAAAREATEALVRRELAR